MSKEEMKNPTPANKNQQEEQDKESENEEQDSEYDGSSDEDDCRKAGGKRGRSLNKPRHGGVLKGMDKKSANA